MANTISATARTVSPPPPFVILTLAIAMIVFGTGESIAGTVKLGSYTPGEISKACKANGGTFVGGTGNYGCIGQGGQVSCKGDGSRGDAKCTGTCPKCGNTAAKTSGIGSILQPSGNTATKGKQPVKTVGSNQTGSNSSGTILHTDKPQHSGTSKR